MAWLPVDVAATIILELTEVAGTEPSGEPVKLKPDPELVYHVLNPTRFHWTRDMLPALAEAGLKFETLSSTAWLERLRISSHDPVLNPPIKLFNWFDGKYGKKKLMVPTGALEYITKETRKKSVAIREIPDVTQREFVRKMLASLQQKWHETS